MSVALKKRCAQCGRHMSDRDNHEGCVLCLGQEHAELALADPLFCVACSGFPLATLRHRAHLFIPDTCSTAPSEPASAWSERDFPPLPQSGTPAAPSAPLHSGEASPQHEELIDFHAHQWAAMTGEEEEEEEECASMEGESDRGEGAAVKPACKDPFNKEFMEVMSRAVAKLNIAWPDPPAQPPSMLSGAYFQGTAMQPAAPPRQLPCCEDVKQQVQLSWGAPHQTRAPIQAFMGWSSITNEPELGYLNMPPLEESVASHLSSTSRKPQLPSKACQLTASLAEKSYKAAGQVAAMMNNLAILQAYQAFLLRDLEGKATMETYTELRKATDFSLRMITCAAQDAGRIMGFSVVTHRHLWLNLTQMTEWEKKRLLNAPVSTSGLFGPMIQDMAHKFERQQKDAEAFKSVMPRRSRNPFPAPRAPPHQSRGSRPRSQRSASSSHSRERPQQAQVSQPTQQSAGRGWNRHPFRPQQQPGQRGRGKRPSRT